MIRTFFNILYIVILFDSENPAETSGHRIDFAGTSMGKNM